MSEAEDCRQLFLLFYGVLFGAFLSAEMSFRRFKALPAGAWVWRFAWRVGWLVFARSFLFALIYPTLRNAPTWLSAWHPVAQVLVLLFMCTPVYGFQQLSYILVPAEDAAAGDRWIWIVNAVLFVLVPVLLFWGASHRS